MPQISHFISDLHLCENKPELFQLFEFYMQNIAIKSSQLYVLGDLFEVWLGDDCLDESNSPSKLYLDVIALFKKYSDETGKLYFVHGNRDFLLSKGFEIHTGGKIINEPTLITLASKSIAVLHGDSLCTDDIAYQEFRNMVRNPDWQKAFLSQPLQKRIEIATALRDKSKNAQTEKTNQIMDVNQQTVNDFFSKYKVDWLIHGHTHRQATHQLKVDNKNLKRIVLSDWGSLFGDQQEAEGFYLSIDDHTINEHYFSCS